MNSNEPVGATALYILLQWQTERREAREAAWLLSLMRTYGMWASLPQPFENAWRRTTYAPYYGPGLYENAYVYGRIYGYLSLL
jgi:hypothetical protein